jgi:hypothetical protein
MRIASPMHARQATARGRLAAGEPQRGCPGRWRGGVPTRTSYKTYGARESSVVRVPRKYPQSTPEYPRVPRVPPGVPLAEGRAYPDFHTYGARKSSVVRADTGAHPHAPTCMCVYSQGYSRGTRGVLEGYSRGNRGVLEGYLQVRRDRAGGARAGRDSAVRGRASVPRRRLVDYHRDKAAAVEVGAVMWILGAKSTMVTIPRRRFQRVLGFRPPGAAEAGNEDSLGPAGTRASNGPNGSGPDEVCSEENA